MRVEVSADTPFGAIWLAGNLVKFCSAWRPGQGGLHGRDISPQLHPAITFDSLDRFRSLVQIYLQSRALDAVNVRPIWAFFTWAHRFPRTPKYFRMGSDPLFSRGGGRLKFTITAKRIVPWTKLHFQIDFFWLFLFTFVQYLFIIYLKTFCLLFFLRKK